MFTHNYTAIAYRLFENKEKRIFLQFYFGKKNYNQQHKSIVEFQILTKCFFNIT